ncbi:hypothetical protein D1AOALGA4SA_8356 [Olavius algarvensis Delta 1 endosymbiont]|nr:hypothetical protein D1AOALGA4SA_8356 [Olavius algarvensis Delta 1 endosymbiont]
MVLCSFTWCSVKNVNDSGKKNKSTIADISVALTAICLLIFSSYRLVKAIEWTHKRKNSHYISMIR